MNPLTRREFILLFVPGRNTRRIILAVLIVPLVIYIAAQLVAAYRSGQIVSFLILLSWIAVGCLSLFLIGLPVAGIRRAIAASSGDFQSFMKKLFIFMDCVLTMLSGAYLYARWNAGADITGTLAVLAVIFLVMLFRRDTSTS